MAESVDASDLKSDWANNSVPVQVWPGAPLKTRFTPCLFYFILFWDKIMARGGKREGAGRPTGTTKEPTVVFYRRVFEEEKEYLEKCLEDYRKQKNFKNS